MTKNEQETRARRIIERLKMFNRKERDHLMKFALCEKPEAPRISNELWKKISNGGTRPNANRMFLGMDYHLNWLYAALATVDDEELNEDVKFANKWTFSTGLGDDEKNSKPIQDNQEDVDLLVAWFDGRWSKPLRLVLIEAKLDSGWSSEQLVRKRDRLNLLSREIKKREPNLVNLCFYLCSPSLPSREAFGLKNFGLDPNWETGYFEFQSSHKLMHVKRVSDGSAEWEII